MVSRTRYAIPIDAIRRVDASIEQADIGTNVSIPVSSETITAHIEGVEDEFERRAVELTDQSKTEELHEGIERDFGWTVYLDEPNIKPLDTAQGDKVEIRTGQDSWTDVTDESFLDQESGVIEVNRRFARRNIYFSADTNYRFRVTYRYGGTGEEAGETTLNTTISDSANTPITTPVDDASSIPTGSIVLISGDEYFFVSDSDENNDELTFSQRAIRGTTKTSHASGDEIVFLPLNVRDAISAKVATRLLRQDDFQDFLNEGTGDSIDNQQKIEDLDDEFESIVTRYQSTSGYV